MKTIAASAGFVPMIVVTLVALLAPLGMLFQQNQPDPSAPVIVISAPWDSAARVAEAASAVLILPGRIDTIGLVVLKSPDQITALKDAGAWLILHGRLADALCISSGSLA